MKTKAYDNTIVDIPEEKMEEYLRTQRRIKVLLNEGKTLSEIKDILDKESK